MIRLVFGPAGVGTNDTISNHPTVMFGVPQGSVLSPLLSTVHHLVFFFFLVKTGVMSLKNKKTREPLISETLSPGNSVYIHY